MKGKLWLLLVTVLLASDAGGNKDDWMDWKYEDD